MDPHVPPLSVSRPSGVRESRSPILLHKEKNPSTEILSSCPCLLLFLFLLGIITDGTSHIARSVMVSKKAAFLLLE